MLLQWCDQHRQPKLACVRDVNRQRADALVEMLHSELGLTVPTLQFHGVSVSIQRIMRDHSTQPARYSRRRNWFASSLLEMRNAAESHSSFLPVNSSRRSWRKATLPSSTASASGSAWPEHSVEASAWP